MFKGKIKSMESNKTGSEIKSFSRRVLTAHSDFLVFRVTGHQVIYDNITAAILGMWMPSIKSLKLSFKS